MPQIYASKSIKNAQCGIHKNLKNIVEKHIQSHFQKPFQNHNLLAFEELMKRASSHKHKIMDSCCGTGMSSIHLAQTHPDALIIGIDQSAHRLAKNAHALPKNCLMLQANCEDIWRLCYENDVYFDAHYILYPNPWPKSVHLKRRWHGHPTFPLLQYLSSQTILRSNWKVYLEEFKEAWHILTQQYFEIKTIDVANPMTLFEKKYSASGQPLYELIVKSENGSANRAV